MPITVTPVPLKSLSGEQYQKVSVDWTSDGAGNATGAVTLHGYLIKVTTDPYGGPTSYGITLVDPDGVTGAALDALGGLLSARSATAAETKYTTAVSNAVPIFLAGTYTFTVASAGATKSGKAHFYLVDSL